MNKEQYYAKYDELYTSDGVVESNRLEDKVSKEPKHSYLEAVSSVGLMSYDNASHIFDELFDKKDRYREYILLTEEQRKKRQELSEKYNDKKELVVAALSPFDKRDAWKMTRFIETHARAYLYAKIDTAEFRLDAVKANHSVYLLLTEQQRKEPGILDAYREGCLKHCEPNRIIDPKEYYSVSAFEKVYEAWVCGGTRRSGRHEDFLKMAEKVNPEFKEQYDQVRREVLQRSSSMIGEEIYDYKYYDLQGLEKLMPDVEKYCPELNETVLKDYREEHKLGLIRAAYCSRDPREYNCSSREALRADLLKWPETRDLTQELCETRVDFITQSNEKYAIDQFSAYAQAAKNALMRFRGFTEREAVAMVRSSTYEQIEAIVPIKQTLLEAAHEIGVTLGADKNYIRWFKESVIDTRLRRPNLAAMEGSVQKLVKRGKGGAHLFDRCVINALRVVNNRRELSSIDPQQRPNIQQIKEMERKDDLAFVEPICSEALSYDGLFIPIDHQEILREYENRSNYTEKFQWLNNRNATDERRAQVIETMDKLRSAIVDSIARGDMSIEKLTDITNGIIAGEIPMEKLVDVVHDSIQNIDSRDEKDFVNEEQFVEKHEAQEDIGRDDVESHDREQ